MIHILKHSVHQINHARERMEALRVWTEVVYVTIAARVQHMNVLHNQVPQKENPALEK